MFQLVLYIFTDFSGDLVGLVEIEVRRIRGRGGGEMEKMPLQK